MIGALCAPFGQEIRGSGGIRFIGKCGETRPVLAQPNARFRYLEITDNFGTMRKTKGPPDVPRAFVCLHPIRLRGVGSPLTRFEFALGLVDHVHAAFAAHDPAITVPVLQRAERVLDLHRSSPFALRRGPAPGLAGASGCPKL